MILPKVYDKLSKQIFLIDSGACGNFLPASDDQTEEVESHFYDASGNTIKCFGDLTLDVDIGLGKMSTCFTYVLLNNQFWVLSFCKITKLLLMLLLAF